MLILKKTTFFCVKIQTKYLFLALIEIHRIMPKEISAPMPTNQRSGPYP